MLIRAARFALAILVSFGISAAEAQTDVTEASPAPSQQQPTTSVALPDGVSRSESGILALTLGRSTSVQTAAVASPTSTITAPTNTAPASLQLYGFEFDGVPVASVKMHFKQLSPGVIEMTSLAYRVGEWRLRVHDNASYYGLGEHFDTLNHAHTIVKNLSQDNAGPKGTSTYKPIPFFMSTTGYGMWVDTTGEATFDMNVTSNSAILIDATAERLRVVFFLAPKFPQILDAFTALAGRSILPPYWAFAPWLGRDYHQNRAQVAQDIDKARQLGLPASVLLIDSPWATGYNTYLFNPKQFENAPAMVQHIHDAGYKLVLWHTSWINKKTNPPGEAGFADKIEVEASNYAEAAAAGYFVKDANGAPYVGRWWKGEGSLIDFTNAHAKSWWQDQVRQAIHAGADGFKDDDAEGSFLGDVRFSDGTDQRLMRNRYAVQYNNAMEELMQKDLKGNGVLFIRSVTTGANGLGILWGGDNQASFSTENGLPTVVTAGLGAGMSGMPLWSADLGGYEKTPQTPDPALFMRWTEYAAFSPVMETISTANLLPWDYGDQALEVYKKFSRLHMSLFPYRYAAAQQAAKSGMPIMRSLALVYQDDPLARAATDEYLLGPDLLVAPVLNQATERPVYLTTGEWLNYWTGAAVAGGTTIVEHAALDSIPLYVRRGAILPMLPDDVMTLVPQSESGNKTVQAIDNRRVYEVIGGAVGEVIGQVIDTSAASTSQIDFEGRTLTREGDSLQITGDKAAHVILRWRFGAVTHVTVNGETVPVKFESGAPCVEFDYAKASTVAWN